MPPRTTTTTTTSIKPLLPLVLLLPLILRGNPSRGFTNVVPSPSSRRCASDGESRLRARHDPGIVVVEDENDDPITNEMTSAASSFRVGIVGAGSIALGTASLLARMGHDPMIWSPSSSCDPNARETTTATAATTTTATIRSTGALRGDFVVRIARDPRDLVTDNDGVLLFALPVNGHRNVMERLAPAMVDRLTRRPELTTDRSTIHVIISSHASLGAVYLMKILREECLRRVKRRRRCEENDDRDDDEDDRDVDDIMRGVRITAWGTTVVTARRTSETSVHVPTVRQSVDYCTVPSSPPAATITTTAIAFSSSLSSSLSDPADVDRVAVEGEGEGEKNRGQEGGARFSRVAAIERRGLLLGDDGHDLCTALFGPRFRRRDGGLLAITLSNLNPQNHLGIVLGNMSRMDPPPPPPPLPLEMEGTQTRSGSSAIDDGGSSSIPSSSAWPSWYQGENVTPNIGRLMEALDSERLNIAKFLDVDVRTIHEHFSWSFGVPMETPVIEASDKEGDDVDLSQSLMLKSKTASMRRTKTSTTRMRSLTVSEMNQMMHHHLNNDVLGPVTPDTRYVLEDVPYGLVPTVLLGRLVGRPAILHESGIRILSAMYGRDFMNENDLFQGLGLLPGNDDGVDRRDDDDDTIPSLERWREMAYSGSFWRSTI
ncbi:hypothetical protein ACHAXA_008725 [Cyclostephanos tholiformis]|uniref:Opine dehydrogenase domain-containing protein n=1 Tax=Cyclostephanos tholiformis TaxID=382380 RepID=A0ABD3RC37_9STRA